MAVKTYTEQLADVQAAIMAVESGSQAYSVGGQSLSRANLRDLYEREKYLRAMVAREDAGGIGIKYAVPERG